MVGELCLLLIMLLYLQTWQTTSPSVCRALISPVVLSDVHISVTGLTLADFSWSHSGILQPALSQKELMLATRPYPFFSPFFKKFLCHCWKYCNYFLLPTIEMRRTISQQLFIFTCKGPHEWKRKIIIIILYNNNNDNIIIAYYSS